MEQQSPLQGMMQQNQPQGNQGLNMLQNLVMQNYQTAQGNLQKQREAEMMTQQALVEQSRIAPSPQQLDAEAYGAWASTPAPRGTNALDYMSQALGNFNKVRGDQSRAQLQRDMMGAKLNADFASNQEKQAQDEFIKHGQMLKSATGGAGNKGVITRPMPDGSLEVIDGNTGATIRRITAGQSPQYIKMVETFFKEAMERGEYASVDEAKAWAERQAASMLGQSPQSAAQPAPAAGALNLELAPGTDTAAGALNLELAPGTDTAALLKQVQRDRQFAEQQGDYARAQDLANAEKLLKQQAPGAAPAKPMKKKDTPKAEYEREAAGEAGKAATKDLFNLQDAASASSDLKGQLGALKTLYTTPNLPEGALAEQIQGVKSSLKSLGFDIGPEVAAGDMITAISGKMALLTRTADGKNLMPGAMTDFEQRILRGLVPGLNQTAEGRAALIEMLSAMADTRIRLASEAATMAGDRGILPMEWYKRRERILKEEQAKMALINRQLAQRFVPEKKQ